jgi:hypothetical protein
MKINSSKKTIIIFTFIAAIYSLSYGLSILNGGVFWDDWIIYNQKFDTLTSLYNQMGFRGMQYYIFLLLNSNIYGLYITRAVIFLQFFFSGLCLWYILKRILFISHFDRILIVSIFLIFPVYYIRLAVILAPYALCYFLFFLGLYFFAIYLDNKKLIYRFISLLLFLYSFFIGSLLVLYSIVFLYLLYHILFIQRKKIKTVFFKLFLFLDILFLPFLFFLIKNIFLKPYGLYADYNSFNFEGFDLLFSNIHIAVNHCLILPIAISIKDIINHSTLSTIFFLIIFFFLIKLYKINRQNNSTSFLKNVIILSISVVIFFAGIFPYIVINKTPTLSLVLNRHQLLVPLGASLILISTLNLFLSYFKFLRLIKLILVSILICGFIISNLRYEIKWCEDWFKQQSMISNFQKSENIKLHNTFLINDKTTGRFAPFYEFAGYLKKAFGNSSKIAFYSVIYQDTKTFERYKKYNQYNISEWPNKNYQYIVNVLFKKPIRSNIEVCYLVLENIFNHKCFLDRTNEILTIKCNLINNIDNSNIEYIKSIKKISKNNDIGFWFDKRSIKAIFSDI